MADKFPLVITISRQVGSGGACLGQKLAEHMKMLYLDREIINKVSDKLGVSAENIEWRDEKVCSAWQSIFNSLASTETILYKPSEFFAPNDKEIIDVESDLILKAANEKPTIIVGRCGFHILRDHPKHVSVFLHANMEFRQQRVEETYGVPSADAIKFIESADKARARYIHSITGHDMNDARQYHLSIDTGVLGLERTENLVVDYLHNRFDKAANISNGKAL